MTYLIPTETSALAYISPLKPIPNTSVEFPNSIENPISPPIIKLKKIGIGHPGKGILNKVISPRLCLISNLRSSTP